jgi:hypothetical protein
MRIIIPGTVSLTSSTVTGSTYDEWVVGTSYDTGDKVKVSFEDDGITAKFPVVEYECLADATVGKYPEDYPDKWSEIGAENRCKMFDDYTNTQTEDTVDITVVVDANGFNCVGLFNLYGTLVTLSLKRGGSTISTKTFDLRTLIPESGWYAWLFTAFEYGITQVLWDFTRYATGATLEATITTRSSEAKCGMLVLGNERELGLTQYNPRIGITDYSIKSEDSLGRTYLSQGNYAKRADIEVAIENTNLDFVTQQLTSVRGIPAIYDFNGSTYVTTAYECAAIYGYLSIWDVIVPGPKVSRCNMEIKGLI